jgi:hypothetical protein
MKDERSNIVKFRPRPKQPPAPARSAARHSSGEPAINWSRAPKALVMIVIFFVLMWVVSSLAGWISNIGMG